MATGPMKGEAGKLGRSVIALNGCIYCTHTTHKGFLRDTLNAATGGVRSKSAGHEAPPRSASSTAKPSSSTPIEPSVGEDEDEDEEMADQSEMSDDEGGLDNTPREATYVKMLKDIYRGRPDKAAHVSRISVNAE